MSPNFVTVIAVVSAAAVLVGWFALRSRQAAEKDDDLRVVTRTRVGVGRSLVLVEVDGRRLLLGSTREQWCALADLGSARPLETQGVFDGIEAELLRASESARHRRRMGS